MLLEEQRLRGCRIYPIRQAKPENARQDVYKRQETNSLRHINDGFPKIVIVGGLTPSHVNADGISIINVIYCLIE